MGTFNNAPFAEGEAITANAVNTKAGTLLETPVNALDESSIERHALSSQHLPALSMSDIFSNGYDAGSPGGVSMVFATDSYNNTLPLTGGNYPYTYQTFDATAGTNAPNPGYYGPVTGPAIDVGWRIPALTNNTTYAAEIALDSARNFTTERIKGVLCEGSVEVYEGATVSDLAVTPTQWHGQHSVAVAIGWEDGGGTRHIVERSVRFYSTDATFQGNASTMTFLTPTDLADGDKTCAKIFLAVGAARPGNSSSADPSGSYNSPDGIKLEHYNLSVLPLQAGDL